MGTFKEALHPRGRDGRFIKKTDSTGWLAFLVLIILALVGWGGHSAAGSTGQSTQAGSQEGLSFTPQRSDFGSACAPEAYGQVQRYLTTHHCVSLHRGLYQVTDNAGHVMSVATATVTMPSASAADTLRTLVDRPGTGNITEFGHDIAGEVQFTGLHYASSRDGATVHIAEAEPQPGGAVPTTVLHQAATAGLEAPQG